MDESAGQRPIQEERLQPQTADVARDQRWSKYVQRVALADPQALADLYDESSSLIFSIACRILTNRADAEEITFDVYTYVWQSAARFDSSRASVATWLIMLTRSRAIDRLRSTTLRKAQDGTNGVDGNLLSIPLALSSDDSNRVFVLRALQRLEPADRELLELVFYSGLSHTELAARQQAPLGTVKTRVRAALGRLRKLLGDR